MKKSLRAMISVLLVAVCALGLAACGGKGGGTEGGGVEEKPRIHYEGVYQVSKVTFENDGSTHTFSLGEGGIFGNLTKDLAVVTLREDGTMDFHCTILPIIPIVKFDVDGTWSVDETEETKITAVISGESVPATCDGSTISITYRGVSFVLKKD